MTFFIGFTMGSCNVRDVAFEKVDASDTDSDAGSDASSDAGGDSEITMLDSGSNILESGVNGQDAAVYVPEGGIESSTPPQPPPLFECPDESEARSEDACMLDLSSNDRNYLFGLIPGIGERVDSKDDCIPSTPPYFFPGIDISAEDFETTPDSPFSQSPCPQICEAGYDWDLEKLVWTIFLGFRRFYYVDSNDENIIVACPLTCEVTRCWETLLSQLGRIRQDR